MINASTGNIRIMNSIEMLSWSLTFFLLSAPRTDPTIGIPYDPYRRGAVSLRRARWPDQRRADGLGHAQEDHHAWPAPTVCKASSTVPSAAGRYCDLLVARTSPAGRCLRPPATAAATDVAFGRRDRIAGLHAGRAVLGSGAAQLHDPIR